MATRPILLNFINYIVKGTTNKTNVGFLDGFYP